MSDYINREDALTYFPQYPLKYSKKEEDAFLKGYQQHRIQTAKCEIVDVVERKRGKWKEITRYGIDSQRAICECSVCGRNAWVYDDEKRRFKYCPNCGAKMERSGE